MPTIALRTTGGAAHFLGKSDELVFVDAFLVLGHALLKRIELAISVS